MNYIRNTEGDLAEARWQSLTKIGVDTLIKVEDVLYTKYYRTNYLLYKQEGKGFMECYYRNVLNSDKRKFGRIHKIGPISLDIDTIFNYYHINGDKIKSAKFEFRYYTDSRSVIGYDIKIFKDTLSYYFYPEQFKIDSINERSKFHKFIISDLKSKGLLF